MNYDQATGIARILIAYLVAKLVASGIISNEIAAEIVSLGTLVVMAFWSYIANTLQALLAKLANSPDVHKIIVKDASVASAVPSPKVVSVGSASGGGSA